MAEKVKEILVVMIKKIGVMIHYYVLDDVLRKRTFSLLIESTPSKRYVLTSWTSFSH
jgi:hypothetical protein